MSDETGRNEVYVRPFPGVDAGKTTVSVSQGAMVQARISTVPAFGVRSREVLFPMSPFPQTSEYTLYDIAPDGGLRTHASAPIVAFPSPMASQVRSFE